MKWMLAGLLSAVLLLGLMGCGKKETADEPNKAAEKPDVTIDYGESELYTKEELDDAIAVIEAEFSTWEGCELHSLTYGGDDACSEENVAWMNELRDEETSPEPFTQCVLFESSFHSPVEQRDAWDAEWFLRAYDFFGNKIGVMRTRKAKSSSRARAGVR